MNRQFGSNDGYDNFQSTPQNVVTTESPMYIPPKHAHFAANDPNEKGISGAYAETSMTTVTNQPMGFTNQLQPLLQANNCPPGLEALNAVDHLIVHQKTEMGEAIFGFETNNRYDIKNKNGDKIYSALETGEGWWRHCLGSNRWFDMKIMDIFGNVVMNMHRPWAYIKQNIDVSAPPGYGIGRVDMQSECCQSSYIFNLKNELGQTVLTVEAPACTLCSCSFTATFTLYDMNKTKIGEIQKHYSGFLREMFTDADDFSISFPIDLDVKMKAVCLSALFLIDMLFFEKNN